MTVYKKDAGYRTSAYYVDQPVKNSPCMGQWYIYCDPVIKGMPRRRKKILGPFEAKGPAEAALTTYAKVKDLVRADG